jgi:hypothetical protein
MSPPPIGKGRGRKPLAVPTEAHKIHMRPETWAALVKAAGSARKVGRLLDLLAMDHRI